MRRLVSGLVVLLCCWSSATLARGSGGLVIPHSDQQKSIEASFDPRAVLGRFASPAAIDDCFSCVLGLYDNAGLTSTVGSMPTGVPKDVYLGVNFSGGFGGLSGIEFSIAGLEGLLVIGVEPLVPAAVTLGSPPAPADTSSTSTGIGGMNVAWATCLSGNQALVKISLLAFSPPSNKILQVKHKFPPSNPAWQTPVFTQCDGPTFTATRLSAGCYGINMTGPLVCPGAPANNSPACNASVTTEVSCDTATSIVALSSSGSFDPDGDPLSFQWSSPCAGALFTPSSTDPNPTLTFLTPAGTTNCSALLTLSDGRGGTSQCTVPISVTCGSPGECTVPTIGPLAGPFTLRSGECTPPITKTACLPGGAITRADILFSVDRTGSMGDEIEQLRIELQNVVAAIAALVPDAAFGVISYMDYPQFYNFCGYGAGYGTGSDVPYQMNQSITTNLAQTQSAIAGLTLGDGTDVPESYSRAFFETYSDPSIGWRPGAQRIVVNVGDNVPHDCAVGQCIGASRTTGPDPGRDGIAGTADDLAILDVVDQMGANNITLIHLNSDGPGSTIQPLWECLTQRTGTGGTSVIINRNGTVPGGLNLAQLIADRIRPIGEICGSLTLHGGSGFESWVQDVTPASYPDVGLPATRDFSFRLCVPPGTAPGEYAVPVCVVCDGGERVCDTTTIVVPADECTSPLRVDPITGHSGERVTTSIRVSNSASAIDAFGCDLAFDSTALTFVSASACGLTTGWERIDARILSPGVLRIGGFDDTPVPAGSTGSLVCLTFDLGDCPTAGSVSQLTMTDLVDDFAGLLACPGQVSCEACLHDGDVNEDATLTPDDARCAFMIYLNGGTVVAGSDCDVPGSCEAEASDVNCDGNPTPGDALAIFERWLSGNATPEDCFAAPLAAAKPAHNPFGFEVASVRRNASGEFGVPVVMNALPGHLAFGFEVRFDPAVVEFQRLDKELAAADWDAFDAKVLTGGRLRVGAFDASGVDQQTIATAEGGRVTVAYLWFRSAAPRLALGHVTWFDQLLGGAGDAGSGAGTVSRVDFSPPQPNPAMSGQVVSLRYAIPRGSSGASLTIHDARGRVVRNLLAAQRPAGSYSATWDRTDNGGRRVAAGIYVARLRVQGQVTTRKIVLLD